MAMTCSFISNPAQAEALMGDFVRHVTVQPYGDAGDTARHVTDQTPDDAGDTAFASALCRKGFENIRIAKRNDTIFAGFENRAYRWEPRALAEALAQLIPITHDSATLSLTLLRSGIPVVTLVVTRQQYLDLVNDSTDAGTFAAAINAYLSAESYRKAVGRKPLLNPSYNKIDFSIAPLLRLQLGNFDQPLEMQFSLMPAVQVNFFKGFTFTGQVIVPLYNNLEPEGNRIRPGVVALSQAFRLPHDFFASVSAGYFTRNRYGINGQVRKYFFNGRVAAGASLGYTGSAGYEGDLWMYSWPGTVTWSCDASWRWSRQDMTIRASAGTFIAQDFGWRMDVSRQFGEVTIGFFAMQTGGLTNGGFNFIVPIPPRKYSTKHRLRVRPASYVPWEYRAKGLPPQGRSFSTGNGIDVLMEGVNADYVRRQVGGEVLRMTSGK